MRLLYLANIRLPTEKAHGIQIMENCSAFAKSAGCDVVLAVPRRFNKIHASPFDYYNLKPVFRIYKLWCLDLLVIPIFKRLWFILETIIFTVSAWFYVIKHKEEIDVLYTREVTIAACLSSLKPLFCEVHNLPCRPNWFYRRAFRKVRGIIVISENLRNDLLKRGVPVGKMLVARDSVNLEKFDIPFTKSAARRQLNLPDDYFIAVYTGHLYAWKGADLLAEAGELLSDSIHIYLVGGAREDAARFRARYQRDNVHIIGWRPQAEIPFWLKAADVLVLPNSAKEKISSHYTSPLKLFEYMASGRPIIASDLPSIREVLDDTEAIFFTADNRDDLAKKIVLAKERIARWRDTAQALSSRTQQYSWPTRSHLIMNFVKLLMA